MRVICICFCVKVAESAALVGEKEDIPSLEIEYAEDDAIYLAKIEVRGHAYMYTYTLICLKSFFFVFSTTSSVVQYCAVNVITCHAGLEIKVLSPAQDER